MLTILKIRTTNRAQLIPIAVFLFATYKSTSTIAVDCLFHMETFSTIGSVYTCEARILFDENEKVTWVYGTHQIGKGHGDVNAFYATPQNLHFFPTNIENFFPNVVVLYFRANSISYVSNGHLTPFRNLQYLSLQANKITSLDSNLFSGLISLKFVNFNNNNIRHVAHDINLPDSGCIYFNDNTCIHQQAETPAEITFLKLNLLRQCPPTILQIETTLEKRPNLLTQLQDRNFHLERRVASLEAIVEEKLGVNMEKPINEV